MSNQALSPTMLVYAALQLLATHLEFCGVSTLNAGYGQFRRKPFGAISCFIEWELEHISSQDMLRSIDKFSDEFLLQEMADVAKILYDKSSMGEIKMLVPQLPGGCEWAENCVDKRSGVALRMVRSYDLINDRMLTSIGLEYFVIPHRRHLSGTR